MPHNAGPAESSTDVLVVGAGVIGLACAWRAAQRGLRVCLLERESPGHGATRVAAGMLAPVGEASWGEEPLLQACLASAAAWPRFAEELAEASGREVGYDRCGAVHVALDRDEAEELRRRHELHLSLGLDAEWLRPSECRRLEPGLSTSIAAGVHAPGEAAADPRTLAAALAEAFTRAGGELIVADEPAAATIEGDRVSGLATVGGQRLSAEHVVLACGAWSGRAEWLPASARPPVRPVKGQIVELRSKRPVCERILASPRVYAVPRADGRLIVGATVEEMGFDEAVTAGGIHELLREAYRLLPEVAEMELMGTSAGLRPGTPDNAPLVGPGAIEGLLLATGHFRNGILLAPLTAEAIAAELCGDPAPEGAEGIDARRLEAEEVRA